MANNLNVIRNSNEHPIDVFDLEGNKYTIGPRDRLVLPSNRNEVLYGCASHAVSARIEPENEAATWGNFTGSDFNNQDNSQQKGF